jgi:acetylornithine deacetylase/succinyl-diaminopimelate desuccinylase-like protein
MTENQPAMPLDQAVCQRLRRAAGNVPMAVSGALHDAAILAPHVPTAMIFIASRDGISHNPAEFSRVEDIAAAATILRDAISL